jgi:CRISPR/Cas system-associated exonuclease Cas4 (RecB family)
MDAIADKIYAVYEAKRGGEIERTHLGASEIGRPCDRELWYSFRKYPKEPFPPRMLRLFNTGQREELRVIEDLKAAGYQVEDGQLSSYVDGFGGSIDGKILYNDEWHILEIKTHNEKSFTALQKVGVQAHKPEHYAQMQIYMGRFELKKALYFSVNKNTDEIYTEVVEFSEPTYDALTRRAKRITDGEVPPKLNENPAYYICKWCAYRDVCHTN